MRILYSFIAIILLLSFTSCDPKPPEPKTNSKIIIKNIGFSQSFYSQDVNGLLERIYFYQKNGVSTADTFKDRFSVNGANQDYNFYFDTDNFIDSCQIRIGVEVGEGMEDLADLQIKAYSLEYIYNKNQILYKENIGIYNRIDLFLSDFYTIVF